MKTRITIKVHARCDKCRTHALKVAAEEYGVNSVALAGEEKIVVIGDRVYATSLTKRLYKKIGYAWLESVEEVKPLAPPPPPPPPPPSTTCGSSCNCQHCSCQIAFALVDDPYPSNNCVTM